MKMYRGNRQRNSYIVTVDGKPLPANFSYPIKQCTFSWGESREYKNIVSSPPYILSFSLLADCIGDESARIHYTNFADGVIFELLQTWEIASTDIEQCDKHYCDYGAMRMNVKFKELRNNSELLNIQDFKSPQWPQLLENPNYRLQNN